MRNPLTRLRSTPAADRIAHLEAQVAELQESVEENRRLNERLSDVLDVITELLVPAADRDDARVVEALEKLQANAHEFRELRLLSTLRTTGVGLNPEFAAEAEALIGGLGAASHVRLGLGPDATPEQLADEARRLLSRWRALAENPLTDRAAQDACRVVIRSCEGIVAECSVREFQRQLAQHSSRQAKPLPA